MVTAKHCWLLRRLLVIFLEVKYVDENVAKLLCLFQQSISPQVKRHKSYKENSTRKVQLKHTRKKN